MTFSNVRFSVHYQVTGTEEEARRAAATLCLDQTVELTDDLVPPGVVREQILGRVESLRRVQPTRHQAVVSFACELIDQDLSQLLNVTFGMSSLKRGVRLLRLDLPDALLGRWRGPRFGRAGLRERLGVHQRALVCGVLKPLGLSAEELAELAYRFALGGLDLIKDDQGLVDQDFCRFEDRVARSVEAVARAVRETKRPCLYVPHVTGSWDVMRRRASFAKRAGAGGVLVCPGLTGFDAMRALAEDDDLALPVFSHPDLLGTYAVHDDSGIAPAVLFGQLPRLAGADVSIYPQYDTVFPMTREDCRAIAEEGGRPWGRLKPLFPTAAGGMTLARAREASSFYGGEVVVIAGGTLIEPGADVVEACRRFMEQVARS